MLKSARAHTTPTPPSFSHTRHSHIRTWSLWPMDRSCDWHMMSQSTVFSGVKPPSLGPVRRPSLPIIVKSIDSYLEKQMQFDYLPKHKDDLEGSAGMFWPTGGSRLGPAWVPPSSLLLLQPPVSSCASSGLFLRLVLTQEGGATGMRVLCCLVSERLCRDI